MSFPNTLIFQHRKENKKKCTLQPIRKREDIEFIIYPKHVLPPLAKYIILKLDAPQLTEKDKNKGILLVDATWKYSDVMLHVIQQQQQCEYRSIPEGYETAYPRKQEDCIKPDQGLASIEALFIAYHILRRNTSGLLDKYHFKNEFLKKNHKKLFF